MATIKSYSDLQQSKKLAEILSPESADMVWEYQTDKFVGEPDYLDNPQFGYVIDKRDIACWSLAALLDVLPRIDDIKPVLDLEINYIQYPSDIDLSATADNPIDACAAMIERLHELKML